MYKNYLYSLKTLSVIALSLLFFIPTTRVFSYPLNEPVQYLHGVDPSTSYFDITDTSFTFLPYDSNTTPDGIAPGCASSPPNLFFEYTLTNVHNETLTILGGNGMSAWTFNYPSGWGPVSLSMRASKSAQHTQNGWALIDPICDSGILVESADGVSPFTFTVPPNQPPSVLIQPYLDINEGDPFSASGSYYDEDIPTCTATVDYGDGTGVQPLSISDQHFDLSHMYSAPGTYTITVNIIDSAGLVGTATGQVIVHKIFQLDPTDIYSHGLDKDNSSIFLTDATLQAALRDSNGDVNGIAPACSAGQTFYTFTIKDKNGVENTVWGGDNGGIQTFNFTPDFIPVSLSMQASKTFTWDPTHTFGILGSVCDSGTLLQSSDGTSPLAVHASTNNAPQINAINNATINEGSTYSSSGSFTDTDSSSWTAAVDYGDNSGQNPLSLNGKNFSLSHIYKDNGTYTVTVNVTDNQGAVGTTTATITVNNVAPSIISINAPSSPVIVNTSVMATGNFKDLGVLDRHTASWDWGDGAVVNGAVTESSGSGTIKNSHSYTQAGLYVIKLTVKDNNGGQDSKTYQYVTVYKPTSTALFSGSVQFYSPAGALKWNSKASGNVTIKFSERFSKSTPKGSVDLDFKAGNFYFNLTSASVLVTSKTNALFRGYGKINGKGTYQILITGNNSNQYKGKTDNIRVQIKTTSGDIVYDSQPGQSDNALPTTSVKGNIIICI